MKNEKKLIKFFTALFLSFSLIGCEIGLGAAVDTEAPSVEINTPEPDVIIRDSFAICGTYKDDGTIKSVKVVLSRTDKNGTTIEIPGTIEPSQELEGTGNWKAIINPKSAEEPIIDGSYMATVTVEDYAEHKTVKTVQFKIDNTAPIIVLQRPGTTPDSETPDSYGQSFTLEGQAADDNNVSLIQVKIYSDKECLNEVYTVPLYNVPNSINLDVAKFEAGIENIYSAIYGAVLSREDLLTAKEKPLYCKIVAYDGAQRYPDDGSSQSAEDTLGNFVDTYYLYDDIATEVLTNNKITDVYHMFSGAYLLNSRSLQEEENVNRIKRILSENVTEKGYFSLNPANNPIFTVAGRDEITENTSLTDRSYSITNGTTIQVEVQQGLDKIPLDVPSIVPVLYECDYLGNILPNAQELKPLTSSPKRNGSTYQYIITLDSKSCDGLVIGHYYRILVKGNDQKGNTVVTKGSGYAFRLASSGAAPEVTLTAPTVSFINAENSLYVAGNISISEGNPTLNIKLNDEIVYTKVLTDEDNNGTDLREYSFSYTVPKEKIAEIVKGRDIALSTKKLNVLVEAIYDNIPGKAAKTVVYDVDKPTIEFTSHNADIIYNEERSFSGSTVMFSGNSSDSKVDLGCLVSKIKYSFTTSDVEPTEWKEISSSGDWYLPTNLYIDSNSSQDALKEGNWILWVKAVDLAGNESDVQKLRFSVDQTAPEYSVTGLSEECTYTKSEPISFELTSEEEGLNYSVILSLGGTNIELLPEEGTQNYKINPEDLQEQRLYTITIKVTDSAKKLTQKTYKVMKDNTPPVFEVTNPGNGAGVNTANITINGTVVDKKENTDNGCGVEKIQYKLYRSTDSVPETWEDISVETNSEAWSKEVEVGNNEGELILIVRAVDKNNNISDELSRTFYCDKLTPKVSVDTVTTPTNKAIVIAGKAVDSNEIVKVEIFEDEIATPIYTKTFTDAERAEAKKSSPSLLNTNNWSFTTTNENRAQGEHNFTVVVTDIVNKTDQKIITVVLDTVKPKIDSISVPDVDDTQGTSFNFNGRASDENSGVITSGVKEVYLKLINEETNEVVENIKAAGSTDWFKQITFSNYFKTSGEKSIWVKAIDYAENESDWKEQKFIYDTKAPEVHVKNYAYATNSASPYTYGSNEKAGDSEIVSIASAKVFKISGNFNDDWEMAENDTVVVKQKIGNGTYGSSITTGLTVDKINKTWELTGLPRNAAGDTALSTGTFTYEITVKDKAGKTSSKELKVTVDVKKPEVKITSPSSDKGATIAEAISGGSYNFKGTVTDVSDGDSGVESYSYAFTTTSSAPAANSSEWTEVNFDGGEFSIYKELVEGTTNVQGKLCEGQWYLYIKAKDKAGNEADVIKRAFYVDLNAPKFSVDSTPITSDVCKLQGGTYFFKGDLEVKIDATDTNAMAGTNPVTFKIGTTSVLATKSGNKYTISASKFTEDYQTLTVTAKDIIGRPTEKSFNVYKDETAPILEITKPTDGSNESNSAVSAVISITEDGIGIPAYSNSNDVEIPSGLSYSTDGTNWYTTKYTGGAMLTQEITLGNPQGPKSFSVKAIDKLGNESEVKTVSFYYDYEDPKLESETPKEYVEKDATFVLCGTTYDTYKLSYIEVKDTTVNKTYSTKDVNSKIKITNASGSTVLIESATQETPVRWTLAFTNDEVKEMAEGRHTFKIKAYDVSGRYSDEVVETVFIDRTAPTVIDGTGENSIILPTVTQTQSASFKFSGKSKDDTNASKDSRVKEVKVAFTTTGQVPTKESAEWISAVGDTSWDYTMVFSENTAFSSEGTKYLHIKAIDKAGNESTVVTKSFMYDKAAPSVAFSSYTPSTAGSTPITLTEDISDFQIKEAFSLKGTAIDTNEVKRVEVYQGENLIAVQVGSSTDWEVKNLPRSATEKLNNKNSTAGMTGTASVNTGTYSYKIVVYDSADKHEEKQINAKIDLQKPTLSNISPANNEKKGQQAVSSTSEQFSGKASDGTDDYATGVGAVWYKIQETGNTAPTAPTTNTLVDAAWTDKGFEKTTGTTSWNFYGQFKGKRASGTGLEEGNYTLYVYAVDKAGNVSDVSTVDFEVDMAVPKIETTWNDGTVFETSVIQTKTNGSYDIKYKVTETNGLATGYPKLTVTKDGNALAADAITSSTSGDWTTVKVNTPSDALYEYKIEAKDVVGKTAEVTRNVRLDTVAPALTVVSPVFEEIVGGSKKTVFQNTAKIKINGNAEDSSGTAAVYYAYNVTKPTVQTTGPAAALIEKNWTDAGWIKANGTTSWKITGKVQNKVDTGDGEGIEAAEKTERKLYVVAVDNNGLVSVVQEVPVICDLNTPVMLNTSEAALITNGTFTLSGDVYDANGIEKVIISDGTNSYTPNVTGTYATAYADSSKASWSKQFTVTSNRSNGAKEDELSDGQYTFTITTTDIAGKTTQKVREVTIDTQKPVFDSSTVKVNEGTGTGSFGATYKKNGWYNNGQIPLEVSANDKDYLSEIQSIEYSLNGTDYYPLSLTDIGTVAAPAKKATGSIACPDGNNTIYLRARDKAGNETVTSITGVKIDTKAPNTCTTTLSGSVLGKGTEDFVFQVTVADTTGSSVSGIDTVKLTKIGNTEKNIAGTPVEGQSGKYSITIPANTAQDLSNQIDGQVYVTVTDVAGNSQEFPLFTLEVDTQDPSISFASLVNGGTVNGTINISGIASDNKVLESVKVEYLSAADTWTELPKVGITTPGTTNWSYPSINTDPASGDSNKITLFDSNSTKAGQQLKLRATAKDKSGRTNEEEIEVTIDQDTDRPLIKFTNLTNMGTNAAPIYYLKYGTNAQLEGNISDDDANASSVVDELIVSTSAVTSAEGWTKGGSGDTVTYTKGTEVTSYNKKTGEFTFTPGDKDDGSKIVYFYVKDNAGTVFYTANDGTYNETYKTTGKTVKQLYYQNKAEVATKASSSVAVTYKSDSTAPAITNIQIQPYTDTTRNGSPVTALGATVGGTKKNKIELIVKTQDANGILGTTVEVTQGTTTKTYRSNSNVGTGTTWTNTASEAATNTASEVTWTLPKINLDEKDTDGTTPLFVDGEVTVKVTTYDQAGIYANQTIKFNVDKVAPGVNFSNQTKAEGATIYGIDEQTIAVTLNATDVANIKYAVTDLATTPELDAKYSDNTTAVWNEVTTSGLSANIIFDGNTSSTTGGTHSHTLRSWMLKVFNKTEAQLAADDVNKTMYIHIRAEDECGNVTNIKRNYTVIPNGNKPTVNVSYPDRNGSALAGTIRINGNSNVSVGTVSKILVQVDTNFNTTTNAFNESWKTDFDTLMTSKGKSYEFETVTSSTETSITGIVASGTDMWNLAINGSKEFNPDSGSRNMAIRVYAVCESRNGDTTVTKFSDPVVKYFSLDPNAPEIGGDDTGTGNAIKRSVKLMKFTAGHEKDFGYIEAQKPYKSEMWVNGSGWYLVAAVHDNSGIKELTLDRTPNVTNSQNKTSIISYTGSGESIVITPDTNYVTENTIASNTTAKNYYMFIPLTELGTANSCGNINWQLEAVENTNDSNSCKLNININYDNIAPKLGLQTHAQHDINPEVKQSNGFYTLKSYVTDATDSGVTSGLQSVAFYFARRDKSDKSKISIIDPMTDTSNSQLVATGATMTTGYIYGEGLYWRHKTGVKVEGAKVTLAAADANIYVGGLAKLGGVIYRIESKNAGNTEFTLDSNPPSDITVADFAMALVVEQGRNDNTSGRGDRIATSGYGKGYYPYNKETHGTKDDGDLMEEAWDGSSVAAQWQARINSKNIPDGPIEIHYVVFDKSQNYSTGIVSNVAKATYLAYTTPEAAANKTLSQIAGNEDTTNKLANRFAFCFGTTTESTKAAYVSNNAPRIVSVTVGCDYNGNKTIEDAEKTTKYVGEDNRYLVAGTPVKKATSYTDTFIASTDGTGTGSAWKTINDTTQIEVELIGGNGDVEYQYAINSKFQGGAGNTPIKTMTNLSRKVTAITNSGTTYEDVSGRTTYKDTTNQEYYLGEKTGYLMISNETSGITPSADLKFTDFANWSSFTNSTTTAPTWITMKFWDNTSETTPFTDSQCATLELPLAMELRDTTKPNTVINDLYWNSASDNSVYKDVNGKLYGHIELHSELNATANADMNTYYGVDDDKVSGVVVFRGYAYDNKRLKDIKWAIVDSSSHSILPNNASGITYKDGATFTNTGWEVSGQLGEDAPASNATQAVKDAYNSSKFYKFSVISTVNIADGITENDVYLDSKGHKVMWELAVDTSYINGYVAKDAKVYIQATDSSNQSTLMTGTGSTGSPAANVTDQAAKDLATKNPTYKVDIVPYITSVGTRLANKDLADPTIYSRTASGHYPIASDEGNITLSGYNLAANSADVTVASSSITASASYTYSPKTNFPAVNNLNNNDAHGDYNINATGLLEATKVSNMYNRAPNTATNLKLTDDIYFDVWEINSNAATSGAALKYPVMHINPTNGQIGFGFVKGSDSVSFPANGKSYLHYQKNRKDYIGTNFVYDTNGIAHNISIGLDGQFDSGIAGRMLYNNSNWYAGNDGPNKIKQWDKRYSIALESIGIPNGIYIKNQLVDVSGGQGILDTDRFATPAIAASAHTDGTAVYIMYYDSDHDQIRFRYGEVPKTGANRTNTQYGLLNDSKSERQRHNNSLRNGATSAANNDNTDYNTKTNNTAINEDTSNQNDAWVTHAMFEASKDYYALVTGDYYYQSNDRKGGTAGTLCNSTGNQGSEYYAMSVIPGNSMNNDKVVMIWYDNAAKKLMYMYRINLGTNNTADNTDASSSGVANKWSVPKEIYSSPVQDVTMTVDKLNGIHIAAYDQNNADLLYIYLPTYNYLDTATNKPYVCKVDSYSQIGNKVTIETALDTAGTAAIPYISYYAEGLSSLPKVAFLTSGVNSTNAGTVVKDGVNSTNQFTGNWEVSMIPTNSALQKYNVNVGLFKNATSGKLVPTATGTNNTTAQDTRVLYGNGKSHLVVGYAIRSSGVGYIETAMYKGVPTYQ